MSKARNLCDNVLFGIQLAIAYPVLCLLILTSPIWLVPINFIFPVYRKGDLENIKEAESKVE